MIKPIKSKTLDKVRKQAIIDSMVNSPFEDEVEYTDDTIIFKNKKE